MARPAMRDPNGRWSLLQVATAAGVSHRVARTVVAAGYLNAETLGARDVVVLRVAAALLDAPRPAGESRNRASDATIQRNTAALETVRALLTDPGVSKDSRLVVTPDKATVHTSTIKLMGDIEDLTTAVTILPVGQWIRDHRDHLDALASEERTAS